MEKGTKREIDEYPPSPPLSKEAIKLLSLLCFRQDDLEIPLVDCIFVFGSSFSLDTLASKIGILLKKGVSQTLILTGGNVEYEGSKSYESSEAKMIYEKIQPLLSPNVKVLLEERSQNTLENVKFGLNLLDRPVSSLCFLTKNFHCGRSYFTLRHELKTSPIFQTSFEPYYPEINLQIKEESWFEHPLGRARIWGEFLRIKNYGKRDDISVPDSENLISQIEKIT